MSIFGDILFAVGICVVNGLGVFLQLMFCWSGRAVLFMRGTVMTYLIEASSSGGRIVHRQA